VLSAKTKTTIVNARDALDKLLEADSDKSIEPVSNDIANQPIKVETPTSKGVTPKSSAKLFNQAVRALLQAKRSL
jgi:hypothetical protein